MTGADRRLGKYRVLEPIASGGMARVYRAIQPPLNRVVAIKVLQRAGDDADEVERLGREAAALAAIRHPNVVQVLDYDVQDGQSFLVMEFVEGASLRALLARRAEPLPIAAVARIGVEVLQAVEAIHLAGVIHRDLKPANLLVTRAGRLMVADFGIALAASDAPQARDAAGTAAYMAPELGLHGRAGPASDLYAVGVLLYQLATGCLPYAGDTPGALIQAHAQLPVPDPVVLRPDLPAAFAGVIRRAMAKPPGDRFASAGEMRYALEAAVAAASLVLPTALEWPEAAWNTPVISGADKRQLAHPVWTGEDTLLDPGARSRSRLWRNLFIALAIFVIVNGVLIGAAGMLGNMTAVLSRVWPVEILWAALVLGMMQRMLPVVRLLVVAVPVLIAGVLLSYLALTARWHEWWWWLFAGAAGAGLPAALVLRPDRAAVIEASAAAQIGVAVIVGAAVLVLGFL